MEEVDFLANLIREVDGNHSIGAGKLAEEIIEAGYSQARAVRLEAKLNKVKAIVRETVVMGMPELTNAYLYSHGIVEKEDIGL